MFLTSSMPSSSTALEDRPIMAAFDLAMCCISMMIKFCGVGAIVMLTKPRSISTLL